MAQDPESETTHEHELQAKEINSSLLLTIEIIDAADGPELT